MLCQLVQPGAFLQAAGVLLGTFTEMEREGESPSTEEMVLQLSPRGLPVARTAQIGHGADSKAILLGSRAVLGDPE